MLRVYADESFGRHEPGLQSVCVAAGYMASPAVWPKVTRDWRAVLDAPPKISYFRMREFLEDTGAFEGLHEQKPAKFDGLVAVLRRYSAELTWLESAITWDEFDHGLSEGTRLVLKTPVYFCLAGLALGAFSAMAASEPLRFVFDELGGLETDIHQKWGLMAAFLPASARRDLGPLEFADARATIPLQCADLIAWHARQKFLDIPQQRKKIASVYDRIRPPDSFWRCARWNEAGIRQHVERLLGKACL